MIKKLIPSIGEYKRESILAPLTICVEVLFETAIPLLMAYMIDSGISAGNISVVVGVGIALIAAAMIALCFGILGGRFAAKASAGFAKNLRRNMYYNIQGFSFSNIDHFSTSGLVTRLTTDVTNVQNAYQMIVRTCVRAPLMLVFSLVMSFTINVRLGLVFLVMIPLLAGGLYLIMTKAHPIFEKVFKLYDKLNGVVQENLRGIRVVKSYVREDYEIERFEKSSGEVYSQFVKAEKLLALNAPLMQFCMYGGMLLISWFGANFIVGGSMSTGQLTSLISYAMMILMSLMLLSMVFVMVTLAQASAERIVGVLDESADIENGQNPAGEVPDGSVRFDGVDFSYNGQKDNLCLRGISLDLPAGATVGVIGGTGSGKSSLVQLIPRLYDVTNGSMQVGGRDVREYDVEALRNAVAMVLQKNVLFSGSIKDNLRWGNLNATDEEMVYACKLACADGFIRSLPDGYDTMIEQGGANVSGGQKQRLCIARALLKNPKILILDDSTSAVDTKTDAQIRRAFREEIPGTTKIIIAQRISSVQDADQIVVMDDGKISGVGTHDELMQSNEIYREVYESQQKGGDADDAA